MEPKWVTREQVDALHRRSLAEHGGQDGLRDEPRLESALAQPLHLYAYGQPDWFDLAAAYAFHLAENQPYLDGNKRTAVTTALVFLEFNGVDTSPLEDGELYDAMIGLAAKRLDKAGLAALLRRRLGRV